MPRAGMVMGWIVRRWLSSAAAFRYPIAQGVPWSIVGAGLFDVAVDVAKAQARDNASLTWAFSGGAAGNRTRHRNRADLRKRSNLTTRNNAKATRDDLRIRERC